MRTLCVTAALSILLLAFAGGIGLGKEAVTGDISGQLTDAQTGAPIARASIVLSDNKHGAITDSLGHFFIRNLLPGDYTITVTHPDYGVVRDRTDFTVTVKAGRTASMNLTLKRISEEERSDNDCKKTSLSGACLVEIKVVGDNVQPNMSQDKTVVREGSGRRSIMEAPTISNITSNSAGGGCMPPYPSRDDRGNEYRSQVPYDMFFRDYGTNSFVSTDRDRFSTFAVDVDDASYTLIRRYLREGNLPPHEAVRVEEFINHFDYGYNDPKENKFRIFTEFTDSPFEAERTVLKIGIKGREIDRRDRRPLNLTLVVDVSGSMSYDNRMELVKESLRMLVRQLDRNDKVGLVAYGSSARVVLEPVSADSRVEIFRAIDCLHPGGSTYAEAGLTLGYEMANRQYVNGHNNVVVFCSDGVANVGRTSPEAIMNKIERFARRGITMSTFGFGMGNYNDVLLEQLAQSGNGRYAYVNNREEARRTFVDDFGSNMQLLARDVKIQVEFNPRVVESYRLLGYENRDVADQHFRDNSQDGGEVGAGHEITALYELVLTGKHPRGKAATVFVRWKDCDDTEVVETSREAVLEQDFRSFDRSRPELRLALVASRFAEILKGSVYAGETAYDDLSRVAEPLRRQLPSGQTDELLELIRIARDLSVSYTDWQREGDIGSDSNYRR